MGDLRCPCCGSKNIIWDYSSGDIVCGDCGCVVGKIYEASRSTSLQEGVVRHGATAPPSKHGIREALRVLRKTKPGYVINNDALKLYVDQHRHVRIYVRRDTSRLMSTIVSRHPCVKRALTLMDNYPRLSSRTLRVKLAIAYYVCMAVKEGPPPPRILARLTGVNEKHIAGIIRWARRTHLIRELAEQVTVEVQASREEKHHKKRADTCAVEQG